MFDRIPQELRAYTQWVCWRLEWRHDDPSHEAKPTKIPYSPRTLYPSSVTNPAHWGTYDQAMTRGPFCDPKNVFDPSQSVNETGFNGVGFVLTAEDPYGFIDLDDTHGDQEAFARHMKVFEEFNSYSEVSPSGNGLHIIIKGELPHGRRRAGIEVYTNERYMTMTGNVYRDSPIYHRQDLFNILFEQMGGPPRTYATIPDQAQTLSDGDVVERALKAANGDKFEGLYSGDWRSFYPGDDGNGDWSRADFALVDIIAYYTQNRAQVIRIWRASQLGQREKALRDDYAGYMLSKCFDNMLPPVDIEGLRIQAEQMMRERSEGAAPGGTAPSPASTPDYANANAATGGGDASRSHAAPTPSIPVGSFPPGLLGEVAQFIHDASPRPVPMIALAGAIGLMAGITGRAYNVSGTGLNQYVLLLAPTGTGKEAIKGGYSKLIAAIKPSVPASGEFIGPGQIRSDAALLKWLVKAPCIVSTVGEFGIRLKQMSDRNANPHERGLLSVMLDLWNKSGHTDTIDPMAYSDKEKNTDTLSSPSFSIMGESTPEEFYGALDESMVASGLLPRFFTLEYTGQRPPMRPNHDAVKPSVQLTERLATLAAHCHSIMHGNSVVNVQMTPQAKALFDEFDKYADAQINSARTEVIRHLWNRAHLKAMKLGALVAVGIFPFNPTIDIDCAQWATNMIAEECSRLLAKFDAGEIGQGASATNSSEQTQLKEMCRVIGEWSRGQHSVSQKYGISVDMHRDGVVPFSALMQRVANVASFRNDRMGSTNAFKRTLQNLLDADDIREVSKPQMQQKYGKSVKAFVVVNPARFQR